MVEDKASQDGVWYLVGVAGTGHFGWVREADVGLNPPDDTDKDAVGVAKTEENDEPSPGVPLPQRLARVAQRAQEACQEIPAGPGELRVHGDRNLARVKRRHSLIEDEVPCPQRLWRNGRSHGAGGN